MDIVYVTFNRYAVARPRFPGLPYACTPTRINNSRTTLNLPSDLFKTYALNTILSVIAIGLFDLLN